MFSKNTFGMALLLAPLVTIASATKDIKGISSRALFHSIHHGRSGSIPGSHGRNLQSTEASCTDDPFLWTIRKTTDTASTTTTTRAQQDDSIVGFAVGTIHLPRDTVSRSAAWTSLQNVADDACAVLGEVDVTSRDNIRAISDCTTRLNPHLATLSDIPDAALKSEIRRVLLNITNEFGPDGGSTTLADLLMEEMNIMAGLDVLYYHNTPELRNDYFTFLFENRDPLGIPESLDTDLLELGRPSGSLETLEEGCDMIQALLPERSEFLRDFNTTYAGQLREGLAQSYTPWVDAYKCGSEERMSDLLNKSASVAPVEILDAFLTGTFSYYSVYFLVCKGRVTQLIVYIVSDRNVLISSRIAQVLRISTHRPVFVLGLAHWIQGGDQSLEALLNQEGYTMERVEGAYAADRLANIPTDTCLVDADLAEAFAAESSTATISYALGIMLGAISTVFM